MHIFSAMNLKSYELKKGRHFLTIFKLFNDLNFQLQVGQSLYYQNEPNF